MKSKWKYFSTWWIIKRKQLFNLLLPKGNYYTRFVIVCTGRSGSTLLHTYLNSHPQIWSYGEILRKRLVKEKPIISLERMVFKPHTKAIRAIGLKMFYDYREQEAYQRAFEEVVNDRDIKVIHLTREDKRQQLISLKRAEETGIWSSTSKLQTKVEVDFSAEELVAYEKKINSSATEIRSLFASHQMLEVTYEALTTDAQEVLSRVQQFLGVKPKRLFTLLIKQGDG
ncbi:Stf0 family sulfotransferase [Fulvivirga imtechensis]|nr:sulfotransferase [Fulvivirga imtechensis]